jgi:hypothetical protein
VCWQLFCWGLALVAARGGLTPWPHPHPPCAQLFNQLNARKILDSSLLLEGLGQVPLFSAVLAGEALLQASRPPAAAARTSLVKGGGSTRRGGDAGAGLASPCFVRSG